MHICFFGIHTCNVHAHARTHTSVSLESVGAVAPASHVAGLLELLAGESIRVCMYGQESAANGVGTGLRVAHGEVQGEGCALLPAFVRRWLSAAPHNAVPCAAR